MLEQGLHVEPFEKMAFTGLLSYAVEQSFKIFIHDVGGAAVLNPVTLPVVAGIEIIDDRTNGCSAIGQQDTMQIHSGRKKIAVAAPVFAQRRTQIWQGTVNVPALQQEFRGTHRASGEDYALSTGGTRNGAAILEFGVVDAVTSGDGLNFGDQMQGANLCAIFFGNMQIVLV